MDQAGSLRAGDGPTLAVKEGRAGVAMLHRRDQRRGAAGPGDAAPDAGRRQRQPLDPAGRRDRPPPLLRSGGGRRPAGRACRSRNPRSASEGRAGAGCDVEPADPVRGEKAPRSGASPEAAVSSRSQLARNRSCMKASHAVARSDGEARRPDRFGGLLPDVRPGPVLGPGAEQRQRLLLQGGRDHRRLGLIPGGRPPSARNAIMAGAGAGRDGEAGAAAGGRQGARPAPRGRARQDQGEREPAILAAAAALACAP